MNEIRQILENAQMGESPCADVQEVIQQHIVDNRRRIEEMQQLQERMQSAVKKWKNHA